MKLKDRDPDWDGPGGTPRALHVIQGGELWDDPIPERQSLLGQWLGRAEAVMIWAPTGVGKSMLSATLGLAMASGGSALGWTTPEPSRVLLVDGEMHERTLRRRIRELRSAIDGFDPEAARENFRVVAKLGQGQDPELEALVNFGRDPSGVVARVLASVQGWRPDVVIFDNISTLTEMADENNAADAQVMNTIIARFRQAGIAIVVIHHSGKDGMNYRGSSMLATSFDVILGLTREETDETPDGAEFVLKWNKTRNGRDETMRNLVVALEKTEEGFKWNWKDPGRTFLQALVVEFMSGRHDSQGRAASAVDRELWPRNWSQRDGPQRHQVTRALDAAVRQGLLTTAAREAARGKQLLGDNDDL